MNMKVFKICLCGLCLLPLLGCNLDNIIEDAIPTPTPQLITIIATNQVPVDRTVVVSPTTDASAWPPAGGVLDAVRRRPRADGRGIGMLNCGIEGSLPGFSFLNHSANVYEGFDVDFCKVVAVAIFGEYEGRINYMPLSADQRFQAVQTGKVDVLFRNTTWTVGRSVGSGIEFGPTTFHDSQMILVYVGDGENRGVNTFLDLKGKTICVKSNTTTFANLQTEALRQNLEPAPVLITADPQTGQTFADNKSVFEAYAYGKCDAYSADRSQIIARISERSRFVKPKDHKLISLSKDTYREPLGPVYIQGDPVWKNVVSFAVYTTIYAEELRITRDNVIDRSKGNDPLVRQFLGIVGGGDISIGESIGLDAKFSYNIISQVGNYEDIYRSNLEKILKDFETDRGPNKAWNNGQGGVLSSPPFRISDIPKPTP